MPEFLKTAPIFLIALLVACAPVVKDRVGGEGVASLQARAEAGEAEAQFDLGLLYKQGRGVTQDYKEAYIWYSLGAANGYSSAEAGRDEVAARLSPKAQREAQKEAKRRLQKIRARQK